MCCSSSDKVKLFAEIFAENSKFMTEVSLLVYQLRPTFLKKLVAGFRSLKDCDQNCILIPARIRSYHINNIKFL